MYLGAKLKTIEEQEFEFTVWSLTGRDMPSIDGFIAGEEGKEIWDGAVGKSKRDYLLELREYAFAAYKSEDMPLMEMSIEALFNKAEFFGYSFAAHPKAVQGARQSKRQSEIASKPRKTTEKQQENIAKEYWKRKNDGDGYGLTKDLASRNDLSTQAIRNITKKYKQN